MGASYWARWTCVGHIENLPTLLLPHVLAEGYELLAFDQGRQVFDRGGMMKKISWSLNGGRWSDAPVDLSITYSRTQDKTIADFRWKLAVRPVPTTHKEQASFETWIREQLHRIITGLNGHADTPWTDVAGQEILAVQHDPTHPHPHAHTIVGQDGGVSGTATLTRPVRQRTSVQYASTYVEQPPQCQRCWKPAVAIPGTTGRYYCLTCHRHLPRRPGVTQNQ